MNELDYYKIHFLRELETRDDFDFECSASGDGYKTKEPTALLAERTRRCLAQLESERGFYLQNTLSSFATSRRVLLILVAVFLFLSGVFVQYLDGGNTINLLFNAIVGYILWNVVIYILMFLRYVVSVSLRKRSSESSIVATASGWVQSAARRLGSLFHHEQAGAERLGSALPAAFSRAYRDLAGYYFHKMRSILHGWALSLALGIIAGLYLRGLVISYSFYWESTFIHSPEVVETVFRILFAPALFLFQLSLPGLSSSGVNMPGADWIHILALSLVGYVVLPRLWMLFSSRLKADSMLKRGLLDLDDDYYRDILFTLQAGTATEQIVVYGFSVDPESMAQLRRGIERHVEVSLRDSRITTVEWGEKNCELSTNGAGLTVVFNGVQTPELDVHGDFLKNCAAVEDPLFVIVDLSRLENERYQKRRQAWSGFFETLQLGLNHKFITSAVMDD